MLDQLKITVGVAAVTFALTASLTAAMTNESPDSDPPKPAPVVVETTGPVDDVDADAVESGSEDEAIVEVEGEGDGEGGGCVEALTERAKSRERLQSHVDDETFPEGGAAGNQNALDHQCGGAFADTTTAGGEEPPAEGVTAEDSGEAPGQSGGSHGNGQGKQKP